MAICTYNNVGGDGDNPSSWAGQIKPTLADDVVLDNSVAGDVFVDGGTINCHNVTSTPGQAGAKIRGGTWNISGTIDPSVTIEGNPTINAVSPVAAPASVDPWATFLPGEYPPGTAGYLLSHPPTKLVAE